MGNDSKFGLVVGLAVVLAGAVVSYPQGTPGQQSASSLTQPSAQPTPTPVLNNDAASLLLPLEREPRQSNNQPVGDHSLTRQGSVTIMPIPNYKE